MVRESTVSLKGGRPEQCWGHGSSRGISRPWGGRTDLLEPTGNMGMLGSCCHHCTRPSSPAPTSLPREEQLCLRLYEWVAVSSFGQECVLFLHSCQTVHHSVVSAVQLGLLCCTCCGGEIPASFRTACRRGLLATDPEKGTGASPKETLHRAAGVSVMKVSSEETEKTEERQEKRKQAQRFLHPFM